jgi:hypothetical protein
MISYGTNGTLHVIQTRSFHATGIGAKIFPLAKVKMRTPFTGRARGARGNTSKGSYNKQLRPDSRKPSPVIREEP